MRKILRKTASFIVLLCIIITLCLCSRPVDLKAFLEDDRVIEIIIRSNTGQAIIDVEFGIKDLAPELLLNNSSQLPEGGTVTLTKSAASAVITVTNAGIYTSADWYCNNATPMTTGVSDNGMKFTINTANAPFNRAGQYMVTIVGLTKDKRYGTFFNVVVE